ncbi:hypothetical protein DFH11DRAFT_1595515, partial [Phellopilus nigrolimitatus]
IIFSRPLPSPVNCIFSFFVACTSSSASFSSACRPSISEDVPANILFVVIYTFVVFITVFTSRNFVARSPSGPIVFKFSHALSLALSSSGSTTKALVPFALFLSQARVMHACTISKTPGCAVVASSKTSAPNMCSATGGPSLSMTVLTRMVLESAAAFEPFARPSFGGGHLKRRFAYTCHGKPSMPFRSWSTPENVFARFQIAEKYLLKSSTPAL